MNAYVATKGPLTADVSIIQEIDYRFSVTVSAKFLWNISVHTSVTYYLPIAFTV